MKKVIILVVAFCILGATAVKAEEGPARLRVDCRFYGEDERFCYASAIYNVKDDDVFNIRYGVGCHHETIFNDRGVSVPEATVSDGIRPRTAATPRVEVVPQGALKNPGTYSSKLEISAGKLKDGLCYVSRVRDDDPFVPFDLDWEDLSR